MALWPFEQLIEVINGRRALRTTLSGRRAEKRWVNASQEVNVPPGGNVFVTVQAPPGEVWYVRHMRFSTPPISGATTGGHECILLAADYLIPSVASYQVLNRREDYNKYCETVGFDLSSAEWMAIRSLLVTADEGIGLYYRNLSDAPKAGTLYFILGVEVQYIA